MPNAWVLSALGLVLFAAIFLPWVETSTRTAVDVASVSNPLEADTSLQLTGLSADNGLGIWVTIVGAVAVIGWSVYTYFRDKVDFVRTRP